MRRREIVNYSEKELKKIENKKQNLDNDIDNLIIDNVFNPYHLNINQIGSKINSLLLQGSKAIVLIIGETQSGKTSAMLSFIKNFINNYIIPIENIYIITGLSDNDWKKQTKERMPECLEKNIIHRAELEKKLSKLKDQNNLLFIIDEAHIACRTENSIYKIFQKLGFYDKNYLFKNDIKIVEFTATPNGLLSDIQNNSNRMKEYSEVLIMDNGENYTSSYDLLEQERIYQFKQLDDDKNIKELIDMIKSNYTNNFKYHIIRVNQNENVINKIKKYSANIDFDINIILEFEERENFKKEGKTYDLNDELKKKPDKHTFVFIKEKLRCAKTLNKVNLGVLYERYTDNLKDDVIIQGLLGRATGYCDIGELVVYTNIDSIKKYKELIDNNFDNYNNSDWYSSSTRVKNFNTTSRGTFTNFEDNEVKEKQSKKTINYNRNELNFEYFNNIQEVNKYIKDNNIGRHTSGRTHDINGFYKSSFNGKRSRIISIDMLENTSKFQFTDKEQRKICKPCYSDINNKYTLKWCLIYK